jgi:hypothetical protein
MSLHQNIGQNHNSLIADKFFANVAKFKYLGTTVANQNYIREETKDRLNLGISCYCSVWSLLSSCFPSKNKKIKICKTILFTSCFV